MSPREKSRTILNFRKPNDTCLVSAGQYIYKHAMPPLGRQSSQDNLVLAFLVSGLQPYELDNKLIILRGGQGITFLPGTEYGSSHYPEQKGHLIWISLDVSQRHLPLPGMSLEASKIWFETILAPRADRRFNLPIGSRKALNTFFSSSGKITTPIAQARANHHCAAVLLNVYDAIDNPLDNIYSPEVKTVLIWMENNLCEGEVKIEQLANLVNLSTSRLHKVFRRQTGIPPSDYFLRRRIIEAQKRLTEQQTVTQVAMDLGFSSSQYFATVFRRYMLTTPSEWRSIQIKD